MKNIVIGTAGHIDHGKTTLIHALTGNNTDRLKEEQKRGITIELGFTYFDLNKDIRVGIVDVPGHEKFVNNMVTGVVGMDIVMLVIAADEGIMPQTKEHIAILSLLNVKKCIVVLNKCDLVDEEWLELMKEEVKLELEETIFANAPVVPLSAKTETGIDKLKKVIESVLLEEVEEKDVKSIVRLPIDRVFSVAGFGTIVTGTLISGSVTKESTLQIYPLGKECRIRSIQVHGADVEQAFAGQRVAINLSNVKKDEIERGYVLAPIGSMKNTKLLDVKLSIIKGTERMLSNNARLHLFTGTREVLCRVVLLDVDELNPGESGYAQLRLEDEIAVKRGDYFVVRFYSPVETIGGGVVLEQNATRKRRHRKEVIEEFANKEFGSAIDIIEMQVKNFGETMVTMKELAKITGLSGDEVVKEARKLEVEGVVSAYEAKKDTYLWHSNDVNDCIQRLRADLKKYHENYPYRYGIKKAEVQSKYYKKIKINAFDMALDQLCEKEVINRYNEFLQLKEFQVERDEMFMQVKEALEMELSQAKYDFRRVSEIDFNGITPQVVEDIMSILVDDEEIVKVTDQMYTTKKLMDVAVELVREKLRENPIITIAEIRDLLHTSRKSAKPILEYLDSIKVTKKTGAESERAAF